MPQCALINMNHILLVGLLLCALSSSAQNALDAQGRRTGPWTAKYPNGQVRYEGQFDAGVPVGRFTYYHDNGFRSAQMDFRGTTGVCLSEQYDEKGKLMARGRFGSDREPTAFGSPTPLTGRNSKRRPTLRASCTEATRCSTRTAS